MVAGVLAVIGQSPGADTEVRVTGIVAFGERILVSLEMTNFQSRVHEFSRPLRIGERHGDIEIVAVEPRKSKVILGTPSGPLELTVGRSARILHTAFGKPAHKDELYARYGDFCPPTRFRTSD